MSRYGSTSTPGLHVHDLGADVAVAPLAGGTQATAAGLDDPVAELVDAVVAARAVRGDRENVAPRVELAVRGLLGRGGPDG